MPFRSVVVCYFVCDGKHTNIVIYPEGGLFYGSRDQLEVQAQKKGWAITSHEGTEEALCPDCAAKVTEEE